MHFPHKEFSKELFSFLKKNRIPQKISLKKNRLCYIIVKGVYSLLRATPTYFNNFLWRKYDNIRNDWAERNSHVAWNMLELLKMALANVGKPLKKLFKSIEFSHMSIGIVVGGSDAARTAIKFGAINIAAGNVLGLLDSFFTLKPLDDMNITADFQSESTVWDIYFEVRLTLFAAIVAVFRLLGALVKLNNAYKERAHTQSSDKG